MDEDLNDDGLVRFVGNLGRRLPLAMLVCGLLGAIAGISYSLDRPTGMFGPILNAITLAGEGFCVGLLVGIGPGLVWERSVKRP